jgi:hypothetical protein
MIVQLSYNKLVNDAFRKMGHCKGNEIHILKEFENTAMRLSKALDETIRLKITAPEEFYVGRGPVTYCGLTIAKASGRDSGAYIPPGIIEVSGNARSGGSVKNWCTVIEEGSSYIITVPRILFDKHKNRYKKWIAEELKEEQVENIEDLI